VINVNVLVSGDACGRNGTGASTERRFGEMIRDSYTR
jgi:hypothetical protein